MSVEYFLHRHLAQLFAGKPVALARQAHSALTQEQHLAAHHDAREFEEVFRCASDKGKILLGRARSVTGEPYWAGFSQDDLLGQHWWIYGTTGGGKSYAVMAILLQLLSRRGVPLVLLDMKGELSDLLLKIVLPVLAGREDCQDLFANVRIIRPFDRNFIPCLRLTEPEPDVPVEVQADGLAETTLDALGGEMGQRMRRNLTLLSMAAILLHEPLPVLSEWLANPAVLARAARRLPDATLRRQLAQGLEDENKATIQALRSRLDLFFLHTRLALSTPNCLRFADCLEGGVTIFDLGDPPAGCEGVAKFYARVLSSRLIRAVLSRPVTKQTPSAVLIFEEFQEALAASSAAQFERFLALSRSRRVSGWFINQQPAQLAAVSTALVKLLRTNTGTELIFRSSFEDARDISHAFPVPEGCAKPAEERLRLARELTRLPQREAFLWFKKKGLLAQRIRSPRLDLAELEAMAARCPAEIQRALQQGSVSVPKADVEKAMRRNEPAERVAKVEPLPAEMSSDEVLPRLG